MLQDRDQNCFGKDLQYGYDGNRPMQPDAKWLAAPYIGDAPTDSQIDRILEVSVKITITKLEHEGVWATALKILVNPDDEALYLPVFEEEQIPILRN